MRLLVTQNDFFLLFCEIFKKCFIEGGCDTYARDCIQRFRINRMSGYAALYQDFHSKDIEQAIDETQSLEAMMESLV